MRAGAAHAHTQPWGGRTELTLVMSYLPLLQHPKPWALHPYLHHLWDDREIGFLARQPLEMGRKVSDSDSSSTDTGSQKSQAKRPLPLRLHRWLVPDAVSYPVPSSLLTVWLAGSRHHKIRQRTTSERPNALLSCMTREFCGASERRTKHTREGPGGVMQVLRPGREREEQTVGGKVVMYTRRQYNEEFRRTDLQYL